MFLKRGDQAGDYVSKMVRFHVLEELIEGEDAWDDYSHTRGCFRGDQVVDLERDRGVR